MSDLSHNVTFCTHLRYDSKDRLVNLQAIINYYSKNFPNARFIFAEDDVEHNKAFDEITWPSGRTEFYFIKNTNAYYRTRALNYCINKAKTPIAVSLDTDCIVPVDSFNECIKELLKDTTIAWPYNGFFIDISYGLRDLFYRSEFNYSIIKDLLPPVTELQLGHSYNNQFSIRCTNTKHQSVGGIVMFNRDRFIEVGMYNEKFIAWGAEDNELFTRIKKLEHKMFRIDDIDSVCFHLFHSNAIRNNHAYYQSNFDEARKVDEMTKEELKAYIDTWAKARLNT